jgi:hypothetical protein
LQPNYSAILQNFMQNPDSVEQVNPATSLP